MCIAIVKPEGKWLRRKAARNCFENNDDGAGFAWLQGGKVHVAKGYFGFRKFWKDFRQVQQYPCLVHFRIKTHGKTGKENCHPFVVVEGKMAMIHNGIINSLTVPSGKSDTAHFTDTVLKPLVTSYGTAALQVESIKDMLAGVIGGGNKVATLDDEGKFTILNEKAGLWKEGIWWSNTSYERVKYTYTTTNAVSSGVYTGGKKTPTDWSKYRAKKPEKHGQNIVKPKEQSAYGVSDDAYDDYSQVLLGGDPYLHEQHRIVTGLHGQTVLAKVKRKPMPLPAKSILLSCMSAEEAEQVKLYESTTMRLLSVADIIELRMITNARLAKAVTLEIRSKTAIAELD